MFHRQKKALLKENISKGKITVLYKAILMNKIAKTG
jgi:hypothetical protein